MQVTEITNDELNFEAKIVIPADKIINKIQQKLDSLSKTFKVNGFRVGKAPASLVEKEYKSKVKYQITHAEIEQALEQTIKDYQLNPLGAPKIEILSDKENEDLEFTCKLELLPKIDLPNFQDIALIRPKLILTPEEINEQIQQIAVIVKGYSIENVGQAENGDQVTIDATGYINDEAFKDGQVTDYKLVLGSKSFIDNFEEQLVGTKAGDKVEVHVTFPENYDMQEVAGKPAKFIVEVKAVHSRDNNVIIDDEFAKTFDYDTMEDFRQAVSQRMEREVSQPINTIMKMNLFDQLEQMLTFKVPPSLVTKEINLLRSRTNKNDDVDSILENKTPEEIDEYYSKLAMRRVKIGLMLAEYVQNKKLTLQPQDLEAAILAQIREFPEQESRIFDFYKKNPRALENLKGPILEEKAVQHIFEHAVTLTEKDYNMVELEKFLVDEENRIL